VVTEGYKWAILSNMHITEGETINKFNRKAYYNRSREIAKLTEKTEKEIKEKKNENITPRSRRVPRNISMFTSNYVTNHTFYRGLVGEEKYTFNYPTFNGYTNRENFYGHRRNFNKNFNTYNNLNHSNSPKEYYEDRRNSIKYQGKNSNNYNAP